MRWMIALAALALIPALNADPISYDFSVTASSGPLSGTIANGSFTYDSSSIVDGGINTNPDLLTSLNFVWDGIAYDQTTANTGFLAFDATGHLIQAVFGNICSTSTGSCSLVGLNNEQWLLGLNTSGGSFSYTVITGQSLFTGTSTFNLATPEPSTIFGLLTALVLLGFLRRLTA
ncbi:MAG TPA: PEP-CTERM sorting domain-containing protein [Bryobacteraceae bacterium]|nr:PEP-CTERM sorting domain-containing protein [Bryobacteraceae bacterium]